MIAALNNQFNPQSPNQQMQNALKNQLGAKAEAIQMLEEVSQTAVEQGSVAEQMRQRIAKLETQWHSIGAEIEAFLDQEGKGMDRLQN